MNRRTYFLSLYFLSKSCLFAMHAIEGYGNEPKMENSNSLSRSTSASSLTEIDYLSHDPIILRRTDSTNSQTTQDGWKTYNPHDDESIKSSDGFDFNFLHNQSDQVTSADQFKNQVPNANRDMNSLEKNIIQNGQLTNNGDGTITYTANPDASYKLIGSNIIDKQGKVFGSYSSAGVTGNIAEDAYGSGYSIDLIVDSKTGKIIQSPDYNSKYNQRPMQANDINATRPLVLSSKDNKLNAQEKQIIKQGELELNSTEGERIFTLADKKIVVDATGKVSSSNVTGSKYREKLKTESASKITTEQVTREQFDTANNFMAQAQAS